jgi:TolB-like protein/cytochrome c-type biogenesis protein CcmH/NrfG
MTAVGAPVQRLLREIQRRKIDRIAAAYGVAAWVVVQAASIALPTFEAPAWVLKALIVAAVIGFPLTLWIGWHVTPAPVQRHGAPPPPSTATDVVLLVFLGGAILLTAVEIGLQLGLFPGYAASGSRTAALTNSGTPAQTASPPRTSIAVLPFTNMSGDPSKDYFSDGISEELLNQLANASALRVAARTSCFAFKGKSEDIRAIARALNVRAVLEGSVREDGQHIRITAQLIDAANGYHIWSKTYDRDLRNILALQDEIARAITASLTNGPLASSPVRAPVDPDAYRKYLQAQSFSALKTTAGDERAVELLRQITAAQPDFAPAYAALGRIYIHMAEFQNRRTDILIGASDALEKALALDPHNLDALSTHLRLMLMKWDWKSAADDAGKLQTSNPNSVFTLRGLSAYYGSMGFPESESAALREAIHLDPLAFVDLNNLATIYNLRGRYADAVSAANDALALRPDRELTLYTLCTAYAGMRRVRDAQILIGRLLALDEADASQGCALKSAAAMGNMGEAHALADGLARRFPAFVFDETDIGGFYLTAGDMTKALYWFGRAYDKRIQGLFAVPYYEAVPNAFRNAPGWIALKRRPEAQAWQAAHDRLAVQLSGG